MIQFLAPPEFRSSLRDLGHQLGRVTCENKCAVGMAACAYARGLTGSGRRPVPGCGLEVDEPWRLGKVERLEDGPLAVRRLGALAAGAGGPLNECMRSSSWRRLRQVSRQAVAACTAMTSDFTPSRAQNRH
jgi:hypothetical protein